MEAAKLGHGGVASMAGVLGCSRRPIERGLAELPALPRDPAQGRIRRAGAGRQKATEKPPGLTTNFFQQRQKSHTRAKISRKTGQLPKVVQSFFSVCMLEALRKPLCGSSIVKFSLGRRSKFVEHQVNVAELDHRGGGFRFALIVFAIAPNPAIPRICALHDPAFAHGSKPLATFWPSLHLHSPARPLLRQPLFERMIVIFATGAKLTYKRTKLPTG
jgi:hypothetical protein